MSEAEKLCPECAEHVKAAARVCHYCGWRFDGSVGPPAVAVQNIERARSPYAGAGLRVVALLLVLALGVVLMQIGTPSLPYPGVDAGSLPPANTKAEFQAQRQMLEANVHADTSPTALWYVGALLFYATVIAVLLGVAVLVVGRVRRRLRRRTPDAATAR